MTRLAISLLFVILLLLDFATPLIADDTPTPGKQVKQRLEAKVSDDLRPDYWLYLPGEYDTAKPRRWPLLLFLHGAGERGETLELVKTHGPPKLAETKDYPFLVVSPQCAAGKRWQAESLGKLLDEVSAKHRVDLDRVYATGLSMGGYGTWTLAAAFPERFAAIVPICGGGDPKTAANIKHLPIWVFHGNQDRVVKPDRSQEMVDAIKAAGGAAKFTLYPDAGHDSWTATYDNDELYDWLLKQKRKAKAKSKPAKK